MHDETLGMAVYDDATLRAALWGGRTPSHVEHLLTKNTFSLRAALWGGRTPSQNLPTELHLAVPPAPLQVLLLRLLTKLRLYYYY
jgi:hypothetical protein